MSKAHLLRSLIASALIPSILLAEMPGANAAFESAGLPLSHRTKRVANVDLGITEGPDAPWSGGKGGLSGGAAQKNLNEFRLRVPLNTALGRLGMPWVVVFQNARSYWMYRTDGGHAWFVLGVFGGLVDSVQLSLYAHDASGLRDAAGVRLGGSQDQIGASLHPRPVSEGDSVVDRPSPIGGHAFYGVDRYGRIDRVGRSVGSDDLAGYGRWYEFDGHSPDRALPIAAYGGTRQGERAYIQRLREPSVPCVGGHAWRIVSHERILYAGAPLDALKLRCGATRLFRPYFVAVTNVLPRAVATDLRVRAMLGGARPRSRPGLTAAGTTGQIWSTTPNGARMFNLFLDFNFSYIDAPNEPLHSVTAVQVPFSETGSAARSTTIRAHRVVNQSSSFTCSFGSGSGKCNGYLQATGQICFQLAAQFGGSTNPVYSTSFCLLGASDPFTFPNIPGLTGSLGCTGAPVNVVSGNLWYQYQDFQLSGPFGLSFARRYDSTMSMYQGDLGLGWRETYGAYLDLSQITGGVGLVTFYDTSCNRAYLQSLGDGTSSYDQFTGDTLYTLTNGTYKLVTWDNRTFDFNAQGQLTSMVDRIGNTLTINRTGAQISGVSDSLGRSLTFARDSSNRITSITSNPSGVSITLTYGPNVAGTCYAGDLCAVTESDGSVWRYEYYNPASYGGYHLLESVIDPLGNTEESNAYTLVDLGNGDKHYRVASQSIDGGANSNSYAYATGSTTVTTTLTTNPASYTTTTYNWDQYLQQVTSVSGYLCFCRGDSLAYAYDFFGRPLSVTEGGNSELIAAQYGRDVLFTSPDGKTSYVEIAYPSVTQLQQFGIFTGNQFQTKTTGLAYYALQTPQQDLPQTVTEPSVDTAGASVVTTYTFSAQGLPTEISRSGYSRGSPTTHSVSATYDSRGRILTFTGPRTDVSQTTTFQYYPDTDANLARRGQLEWVKDALSHTTTFAAAASPYNTYSIYGGPGSVTDPNSVVTDFNYDGRGRLTKLILNGVSGDPTNLITTLTYNTLGNLTSTTRPLGNALTNSYDSANRPTALTIEDSSGDQREQFAMSYNAASQLITRSAQSCAIPAPACSSWQTQMSQSFTYAPVGTLSTVNDGAGGQTAFSWDKYGNNTGYTAGSGSYQYTTTNGFDPSHLMTSTSLSGSTIALYTHDLQANLTRVTSPSTASTSTFFDDFGCLRKEVSTYTGTTTQTCDRAGNVTSKTDANGATTTTTYDALNRPLVQTSSRSGYNTETVTWTYDNSTSGDFGIGRLASMSDPSGSTNYTYERRGMLASVTQTINGTQYATSYTYDGNGNRTKLQLSQGGVQLALNYTYDYADRPLSVDNATSGQVYVSQALYEPMGPQSQLTYGNGTQETISYDQGYRPTEAKVTSGSTTLSDLSYAENAAGFITQVIDNLNAGYDESFTYGGKATNMLAQAKTGASLWGRASYSDTVSQNLQTANFPGRSLTYGYSRTFQLQTISQLSSGAMSISHDAAGNETAVGSSAYTYSARDLLGSGDGITYTYDGFRRRLLAQSSAGTRAYLYDPDMHLQAESSLTSGAIAYDYIWFGGAPVAQVDVGGSAHWTVDDQRGAPFMQTNSSGGIYWQADYEPFGAVYDERTSDVHQPLRLPGQEAEEFSTSEGPNGASGRFYNGFRWYRPDYGRYTQPDPLGFAGTTYNLYAYASNNPLNYVDPLGLDCLPWQGPASWFTPLLIGLAVAALFVPGFDIALTFDLAMYGLDDLAAAMFERLLFLGPFFASSAAAAGLLSSVIDEDSYALEADFAGPVAGSSDVGATAFEAIGSTGQIGEQWLVENFSGISGKYFSTTQGARFVDQFADNIAYESKVGYQSLTSNIGQQVAKDAELLNTGAVSGVQWHFFTSPVTGLGGPSQPLINALQQAGIDIVIH